MPDSIDDQDKRYGIYLEHLGGILSPYEIELLKVDLINHGIKFLERDKSGVITNNIEEISNLICFYITSPLILGIIDGVLPNAAWDLIKATVFRVFKKVRGEKYTKITSSGAEEKLASFGVEIKLNKNERYIYKFDTITSDETILAALDKILDFTEKQSKQDSFERYIEYLVQFDEENMEWNKTNVLDYIQNHIIGKKK